jgi:hypothetical protein
VLGAIGVFVIERDFIRASAFAFSGAVLTYFGFMHGEAVGIGGGLGVTPAVALALRWWRLDSSQSASSVRAVRPFRIRKCRLQHPPNEMETRGPALTCLRRPISGSHVP